MAVPTSMTDLSVTASSNSPQGTDAFGPTADDYLRAFQAIMRREQAQATAVASAATVDLGAVATGSYFHITGTTTITSFGTVAAGIERMIVFDGALTLTHNATSLILPGAANITTAAGDCAIMRSEGSGNWRCVGFMKANGNAVILPSDVVRQSGAQIYATTGGTADAITLTATPAVTAYTAGLHLRFVASGDNTIAGVTINVNGLGNKNVTKRGTTALVAADIKSGAVTFVVYDGTQFQLINPAADTSGAIKTFKRTVFTSNGTYTPTAGMAYCDIQIQAGGGGGAQSGVGASAGSAGGSGAYTRARFTAAQIGASQSITVGGGGTGGISGGAAPGNGGNSSVGTLLAVTGGSAGTNSATPTQGGAGGTVTTAGDYSIPGQRGGWGGGTTAGGSGSPNGGNSPLGVGSAYNPANANAANATGYGAGGAGASPAGNNNGGSGTGGICIVDEYLTQ
jgi:hypothetical protein